MSGGGRWSVRGTLMGYRRATAIEFSIAGVVSFQGFTSP